MENRIDTVNINYFNTVVFIARFFKLYFCNYINTIMEKHGKTMDKPSLYFICTFLGGQVHKANFLGNRIESFISV